MTSIGAAPQYIHESAGSIMTDRFISIRDDLTAKEVMDKLRKLGHQLRDLHYLYITDQHHRLSGVISLRELIITPEDTFISEVMNTDVISAPVNQDQEEVADTIKRHDFVSLPVIDEKNRLLGVIHVEDILDVVQEEATEDFHKMATVAKMEENLKEASVTFLFRKRIVWLIILVFVNIFSGAGIAYFEETISAYVALVIFLPLLIDSGGNAGSQSATLMIRALAVGDVTLRDWVHLLRKELLVAILLGIAMGLAASFIGVFRGGIEIAIVVSLAMFFVVIVGSLIGMSLPFLFSWFKLDPATASTPLITSVADIAGVFIYFSIATWYLNL